MTVPRSIRHGRFLCRAFGPVLAASMAAGAVPVAAQDSRLMSVLYDPDEIVQVRGRAKVQATIRFAEDERIENVAIGDSNAWQVTPNKRANLLFVKPLAVRAATNMTVVTSERTYFFDLIASPSHSPLYMVSFTYPGPTLAELEQQRLAEQANSTEVAAASDPYAVVDPAELNFSWKAKGDRKLLPVQTYDDGEATFLAWPDGREVPAVLIMNDEEVEGPVNFTVRGDTIVIDGVPREIILRAGKDSAVLTNTGPVRAAASIAAPRPGFSSDAADILARYAENK